MADTITIKQLDKLLNHIDSLNKLTASDWESICDACSDFDIPLVKKQEPK